MIHNLYLRAHIVVSGDTEERAEQPAKRSAFAQAMAGLRARMGYGDYA